MRSCTRAGPARKPGRLARTQLFVDQDAPEFVDASVTEPLALLAVARQAVVVGQDSASKFKVVPDTPAVQVLPPLAEVNTTPDPPTVTHLVVLLHFTTESDCVVMAGCRVQVLPPLAEVTTVPAAPTAMHSVALGQLTELRVAVVTGATDAQVLPPFVVYLDSPLLPTIVQVALAAQAIALGTNCGVTVTVPTADDEA